jgi:hypothetical protein
MNGIQNIYMCEGTSDSFTFAGKGLVILVLIITIHSQMRAAAFTIDWPLTVRVKLRCPTLTKMTRELTVLT